MLKTEIVFAINFETMKFFDDYEVSGKGGGEEGLGAVEVFGKNLLEYFLLLLRLR